MSGRGNSSGDAHAASEGMRTAEGSTPMTVGRPSAAYDADSIETLEGLEAVRRNPGMYIGGSGSEGLMHLVWEIIDNAVDEAAAGWAHKLEVTFHRDGSVEVVDNGRGIPVGRHSALEVSALEVVFTELHAGGKFNQNAYSTSGGLHGVGASVVNAMSVRVDVEVRRHGYRHMLSFKDTRPGFFSGGDFPASPRTPQDQVAFRCHWHPGALLARHRSVRRRRRH